MKPNNPTKKNPYDELIDNASSLFEEAEPGTDSTTSLELEELRKRAKDLKMRFLLHSNHVDRHNLKNICEEGLKLTRKIIRGTASADLFSQEDELDTIEARLILCEQEFQKELKQYDSLQELMKTHSLPSDMEIDFDIKIAKAKTDVYSVQYSPDELMTDYHTYLSQKGELEALKVELDTLKKSLKEEVIENCKIGDFDQIKNELLSKIDLKLKVNNMDSFEKEIHVVLEKCYSLFGYWQQIHHLQNDLDDYVDNNIINKIRTYSLDFDSLRIKDIDYHLDKVSDLKSEVEKRIKYEKDHPAEMGDLLYENNSTRNESQKWYKYAAEKGDSYAAFRMYQITNLFSWLKKSAELGYPKAQIEFGITFLREENKQITEYFKWVKKAADQDDPEAQSKVGYCYEYSFGVQKNFSEAIKWYMMAAEQCNNYAVEKIGRYYKDPQYRSYFNGANVLMILRKAAQNDNNKAKELLKEMREQW